MLCVSSVPASCVHIWFVSCPCFMSLWVNLCPAVCMWLCVNLPCVFSSCLLSLISSGLLVTSRCILSCPALIKYYYLSLYPRLHVPVPPSCVHRDRRPDLNVSGAPSPRFVFCFLKSFYFVPVCLSRGMEVATHYSRLSPLQVGVGVRRIATSAQVHWLRALMPADRGRYPPPRVA